MSNGMIPLVEQVSQALVRFQEAHEQAEVAAAAFAELKRLVGGNEADRKTAKANTPPEEYTQLLEDYTIAERDKTAAAAHLERCEKELNTLREQLQHETATINRATATLADTTAQCYAMLTMAPPARPIVMRHVHTDEVPF